MNVNSTTEFYLVSPHLGIPHDHQIFINLLRIQHTVNQDNFDVLEPLNSAC